MCRAESRRRLAVQIQRAACARHHLPIHLNVVGLALREDAVPNAGVGFDVGTSQCATSVDVGACLQDCVS